MRRRKKSDKLNDNILLCGIKTNFLLIFPLIHFFKKEEEEPFSFNFLRRRKCILILLDGILSDVVSRYYWITFSPKKSFFPLPRVEKHFSSAV